MKNIICRPILFTLFVGMLLASSGCPPTDPSDTVSLTLMSTGQFNPITPIETVEFLLYHPGVTYESSTFIDAAIRQGNPNAGHITKLENSSVVTGPGNTLLNTTKYLLANVNYQQDQDSADHHISLGQLITTKFTSITSTLPSIQEFKAYDSHERPINGLYIAVNFVQSGT